MGVGRDTLLLLLTEVVGSNSVHAAVREILARVTRQLDASRGEMAWEIVPLEALGRRLPDEIRSCWIFAIRAGASTGAERHPNSHQRSFSLTGSGRFELREGNAWRSYALSSEDGARPEERWVSIPPGTWHRLFVGPETWGMISFHTVLPEKLVEEKPVDPDDLEGETHQERYAGRSLGEERLP